MLFKFFIIFTLSTKYFFILAILKSNHKNNFLIIENVLALFYHFFHVPWEKMNLHNLANFGNYKSRKYKRICTLSNRMLEFYKYLL